MIRESIARYLPLLGHVVPTLVIGYGVVIPRSCIAGWNSLTVGFGLSVVSACVAYALGQRATSSCRMRGRDRAAS
jgi:ABC-type Fe3+ transport system permease subunit